MHLILLHTWCSGETLKYTLFPTHYVHFVQMPCQTSCLQKKEKGGLKNTCRKLLYQFDTVVHPVTYNLKLPGNIMQTNWNLLIKVEPIRVSRLVAIVTRTSNKQFPRTCHLLFSKCLSSRVLSATQQIQLNLDNRLDVVYLLHIFNVSL